MFGREDHGLPSEAIDRAHAVVTIPTTEHFSLNIAQAALVGMYELHVRPAISTRRLGKPRKATAPPTVGRERAHLCRCGAALRAIAYFKTRNAGAHHALLRSLVFRAAPDARELTMLRTASIEVLRTIEREKRGLLRALGGRRSHVPRGCCRPVAAARAW
jgi:tRNA C32,U32 (ribose-2'-O)-methylase TrmJ